MSASPSVEPAAPAPASSFHPRPGLPIHYTAPRTPTERAVAEVWEKIFGIEKIGIHDDFFDLGGHTLMAAQVVSRLCEAFQIELPLRCLFERPTVAGLAERIESIKGKQTATASEPIRRAPRDTDLPLSFAQQRMWFLDKLAPGSAFYNLPAAVHLEGRLDVGALIESFARILERHEVLRTTFVETEGRPAQVISDGGSLDFRVHDLSELPDALRAVEARRLAAEEARRPFNLTSGPLMRIALVRLAPQEHMVLLTLHHIVSDGWSVGVLIAEVTTLYNAISEGRPTPLVDLPIQYADFARWQRDWLKGEALESQLAYWRAQLGGELPVMELPGARPRPETLSFRGRREYFCVPIRLVEALKDLSRREEVTFFMLLLAALQTLLYRYSGQGDIIIGSPIANRTRPETEGLIGFFVNTLALRTDLSDNPTFRALLARVREVTLGAYAHQDLPFEHLVDALHLQRNLSYTPIFQVMFILQNAPGRALELPGLSLRFLETDSGTAKFDLLVEVAETDAGLNASVEYNTDLYDASTIQRMVTHFKTLLEDIAQDPDRQLSRLKMAGDEETLNLSAEFIEDLEMEMDF